jgi:RNA recognition motif-containing protein
VRVTILRDKFTNNPRGLAYVEFADVESVEHAIVLTGAELRNRFIRVSPKRTNIKGMAKPKKKTFGPADNANALIQGLLGMIKPGGRFKPKA